MFRSTSSLLPVLAIALAAPAQGALWIDFNSNQSGGGDPVVGDPGNPANAVHNQAGYQSYHARHEVAADFLAATYATTFALTGPASVTLTPAWPNTTANTVQQSIGRSQGQADTWVGNDVNLLRDWIGIDSRTSQAGNGAWDGAAGTPTYMTLSLGGLPSATYRMMSFHHDVENMNAFFTVEVSTNGGGTFGAPLAGRMTNSLSGGTPAENEILSGTAPNVPGGNPADLSSTMVYEFTANGTDPVIVRFAPLSPGATDPVHQMFLGVNGFQLEQIPEPSLPALLAAAAALFVPGRRRRA